MAMNDNRFLLGNDDNQDMSIDAIRRGIGIATPIGGSRTLSGWNGTLDGQTGQSGITIETENGGVINVSGGSTVTIGNNGDITIKSGTKTLGDDESSVSNTSPVMDPILGGIRDLPDLSKTQDKSLEQMRREMGTVMGVAAVTDRQLADVSGLQQPQDSRDLGASLE